MSTPSLLVSTPSPNSTPSLPFVWLRHMPEFQVLLEGSGRRILQLHFVINTTEAEINMKYSDKTLQTSTILQPWEFMLTIRKVRKRISFSHHYQGRIDFNTLEISRVSGNLGRRGWIFQYLTSPIPLGGARIQSGSRGLKVED